MAWLSCFKGNSLKKEKFRINLFVLAKKRIEELNFSLHLCTKALHSLTPAFHIFIYTIRPWPCSAGWEVEADLKAILLLGLRVFRLEFDYWNRSDFFQPHQVFQSHSKLWSFVELIQDPMCGKGTRSVTPKEAGGNICTSPFLFCLLDFWN